MKRRMTAMKVLTLGSMMLAGLAACSGDDKVTEPDGDVSVRRLTITEAATRASLTENNGLAASWTAGDLLTYCNMSRTQTGVSTPYSGTLTATRTARTSQFTGDVVCRKGDYIAVAYPATAFTSNTQYAISLAGQDGTLSGLASGHHHVFGMAQVTEVTGQTATAAMGQMKSLLTVCKFAFVDKATDADIPVSTLAISYGGTGSDAGTYPQTATVAIAIGMEQADVHAAGQEGSGPLTISCPSEQEAVYVALLPTDAERTYRFAVTDQSGNTYRGTARATLAEGDYMEATGLRLTKQ